MPGIGFDIFAKDRGALAAFQKLAKNADATKDAMQRVAKANDEVSAASARLRKTQATEADAIGKVRVATAKLEEIRGNSKAKASQLATAEEALAAAQRKATSASDAARTATTKLADAQTQAKNAGKALADAQSQAFDKIQKKADETGKKLGKSGEDAGGRFGAGFSKSIPGIGGRISGFFSTGLGLAGGAAIAGGAIVATGFIAGFKGALEQGGTQARFQGQLGLSDAEAAKAGKVAGDLYKANYGESLAGVNDAIRSVVQNTNVSLNSVDLKPVTAQVLNLASTFDQDLGGVTRAVGQLIRTGLAKDAKQALDIITKGFQSGADKSEDFLDTLNEYGTQFRKVGIDGATATGLISQGLRAGARDADIVADAIKEFSIRAIDGSDATAAGFKALGFSAEKMSQQIAKGGKPAAAGLDQVLDRLRKVKDPVKQSQIAVQLFGTQAEDLGKALFAIDPSTAVKGLGDVAGAAGQLDKTLGQTPQAIVSSFFRNLKQNSLDSLGGMITAFATGSMEAKGFQGVLERAAVGARKGFDKFSELGAGLAEDAKKWGQGLITGMKNGVDTGNWKPLGASIGNGVASALKDLGAVSGKILDGFSSLIDKVDWGKLGGKISNAILGLLGSVDWKRVGEALGDAVVSIVQKATTLAEKLGNAFKDLMNRVDWNKVGRDSTTAIGQFISGIDWASLAKTLGVALLKSLKINLSIRQVIINSAADLVEGIFTGIRSAIGKWSESADAWLTQTGKDLISGLKNGVVSAAKGIGGWLKQQIVDPVVGAVKSFFGVRSPSTVFAGIGRELIAGFRGGIAAAVRGIGNWVGRTVVTPVVSVFGRAGTWLVQSGKNAIAGFRGGISAIAGGIGRWVYGQVISPTVAPFMKAGTWLVQAGKNVIAGFKNGMVAIWGDVTRWVSGIATWIKNNKGPVSLDGTLLVPAGRAIMSGFLKGLKSGAGPAWDFVSKVGGKTVDALQSAIGIGEPIGGPRAPVSASGNVGIVRTLAAQRGWGSGAQWDALYNLIMGESGFRNTAQNPTSSAYGMFQFLDSTWRTVGASKTSDPWAQTIAGLKYIAGSYGSPLNAYSKWSSRSPHWYEKGTPWVPNDQLAYLHKGEAVVPAEVNRRRVRMPSGGGTVTLRVESGGSRVDDLIAEIIRRYVRVNGGDVQAVLGR